MGSDYDVGYTPAYVYYGKSVLNPGEKIFQVPMKILYDGITGSPDKTFIMGLSNLTIDGYIKNSWGANKNATVTITEREVPESFTIIVHQGWNLISCPLVVEPFMASELGSKGIVEVAEYKKATGNYKIFLMGWDDPNGAQDFEFRTDVGYFVAVDEEMTLTFTGDLPEGRTTPLTGDNKWDLYGWSTMESKNAYQFADELDGVQTIAKYNYLTNTYTIFLEDWDEEDGPQDFMLHPDEGYFIASDTAATINYVRGPNNDKDE
jgi:hypothetical protein